MSGSVNFVGRVIDRCGGNDVGVINVNITLYRLQVKFVTLREQTAPPSLAKQADQTAQRCAMGAPDY